MTTLKWKRVNGYSDYIAKTANQVFIISKIDDWTPEERWQIHLNGGYMGLGPHHCATLKAAKKEVDRFLEYQAAGCYANLQEV